MDMDKHVLYGTNKRSQGQNTVAPELQDVATKIIDSPCLKLERSAWFN